MIPAVNGIGPGQHRRSSLLDISPLRVPLVEVSCPRGSSSRVQILVIITPPS
ncbi:hypothetical protein GFS60_03232 [Rhodococcus sp. WAY2]|nr:hypothetical protein GFS60_03232 [Rhodococcus sp. WAY2]